MGANTYIGNGPNFMVKAIADEQGYATGSFFRYAAVAVLTLSPAYVAVGAYLVMRAGA
jgi:Na+/H+ antiporter NhaD/arsenite permease-like protein